MSKPLSLSCSRFSNSKIQKGRIVVSLIIKLNNTPYVIAALESGVRIRIPWLFRNCSLLRNLTFKVIFWNLRPKIDMKGVSWIMELKLTKYQKMANYVIFLNYVKARLAIFELSDPDSVWLETYNPKFHQSPDQWSILNKMTVFFFMKFSV